MNEPTVWVVLAVDFDEKVYCSTFANETDAQISAAVAAAAFAARGEVGGTLYVLERSVIVGEARVLN